MALLTIFNFSGESVVMTGPILFFETVCIWSKLIAQSFFIPSFRERKTSLGISRIEVVTGATVTSPRYLRMESRVKISTGRFLSGGLNLYQGISPRFIYRPFLLVFPYRELVF